jgi:UPF0176 protein
MNKVATFYEFMAVPDPADLRETLLPVCETLGLLGTILLATEGINGTLAGAPAAIDDFIAILRRGGEKIPAFTLEVKYSHAGDEHFDRLKIRVKREIITFNRPEADPTMRTGAYVAARNWNAVLDDPDVTIIDTRNGFEVAMGSFDGAINPKLTSFSEFPAFVETHLDPAAHKKVAMFCTGGIRCEKASAYMLEAGFSEVFQLQGGILRYLEEVPGPENRWRGECFVFDRRVALGPGLAIAAQNCNANFLDSARQSVAE